MSDFSKGLELSVYLNEHKTKSENKSMTNEYRYFLESNIVGVNRLFVLIYLNPDANSKRFKTQRYYLPKAIVENYNVISNRKTYLTRQLILLSHDMMKEKVKTMLLGVSKSRNHYRLMAFDLSRQKNN